MSQNVAQRKEKKRTFFGYVSIVLTYESFLIQAQS